MSESLPKYSEREERINFITHLFGAILSVIGLFYCLRLSLTKGDRWGAICGLVYTLSMITLYATSALYHSTKNEERRQLYRKIDHASIFLLITGSYTPILLCALRVGYPLMAWSLFGVLWLITILGIVLNFVSVKRFAKFSMVCYLAMGWCIIIALKPMLASIESTGLVLILAGGVSYSIGAILYGVGKRKVPYMHCVFHVFVLVGSMLHFWAIVRYIL